MWIEQTEGARFWVGVLTELRNRGVAGVLIVCCDGLTGLRPIYTATTAEAAEQALEAFAASAVGSRSPAVVGVWRRAWNEFIPLFDLPADIRRVVYTTNH